jgi:hypothetical protein
MGGGIGGLHQNTKGSISRKDKTIPLFHDESSNRGSTAEQSKSSTQTGYAYENRPEYPSEPTSDEAKLDISSLFIAMCYMLVEKFRAVKNKKLLGFISKLGKMEIINGENLVNIPEFENFQKYCRNKSIHQYNGYDIVRKFLTRYFSDSSGVFMNLKTDEWEQYANRFWKTKNHRR